MDATDGSQDASSNDHYSGEDGTPSDDDSLVIWLLDQQVKLYERGWEILAIQDRKATQAAAAASAAFGLALTQAEKFKPIPKVSFTFGALAFVSLGLTVVVTAGVLWVWKVPTPNTVQFKNLVGYRANAHQVGASAATASAHLACCQEELDTEIGKRRTMVIVVMVLALTSFLLSGAAIGCGYVDSRDPEVPNSDYDPSCR